MYTHMDLTQMILCNYRYVSIDAGARHDSSPPMILAEDKNQRCCGALQGEEAHQTVPLREETQIPCFDFRQGRATGIEQVQAFCLNVKSSWYLCFFHGIYSLQSPSHIAIYQGKATKRFANLRSS